MGPLVYSLALGMSVTDVSGKAIANLATEELNHPAPVFHGDTLFCESEVLEKRESQSKPDRGTVKVHTRVLNQDGRAGGGVQAARARARGSTRRARSPRTAGRKRSAIAGCSRTVVGRLATELRRRSVSGNLP